MLVGHIAFGFVVGLAAALGARLMGASGLVALGVYIVVGAVALVAAAIMAEVRRSRRRARAGQGCPDEAPAGHAETVE